MSADRGIVYLVGAGPGDPGLITVRGLALLESADVVIHDRLIGRDLLLHVREGAEVIDVGKARGEARKPQVRINELLTDRAKAGKRVVRLKGGDPLVFGRGCEELTACRDAGVGCIVVPGVSSALAAPAAAGICMTQRQRVRAFAVMTGSVASDNRERSIDFDALARMDSLAILMGRDNLGELAAELIASGRDPATPVACIADATMSTQRVLVSTLDKIGALLAEHVADTHNTRNAADAGGAVDAPDPHDTRHAPVVTVVGDVAADAVAGDGYHAGPLAGKRVVVTRPVAEREPITAALIAEGAFVISCPLVSIQYPDQLPELDDALSRIESYDWIVFSSGNAVTGFWKRLEAGGGDARALAGVRIGVVGSATYAALAAKGIRADVMGEPHTAEGLVRSLGAAGVAHKRVLQPCSNIVRPCVADGLTRMGATVDNVVAYRNEPVDPPRRAIEAMEQGVDAVVFCSPSAASRAKASLLPLGDALVVCIGPTTAEAARDLGIHVHAQAVSPTPSDLVQALVQCIASEQVHK